MANGGNGLGTGWVDTAARVIVQVGFPVVAAAVLMYFVLFRFGEQMAAIAARLEANAGAIESLEAQGERVLAEEQRQTAALEDIVRALRAEPHGRGAPP